MTNHQSNIIFYTVISIFVTAIIIHVAYPDFFADLVKSKEELILKDALEKENHSQALASYQKLVSERITIGNEINAETAAMYEDIARLHSSLGNTEEEKTHYLKSLNIKEQLDKNDVFAFSETYYKLGILEEEQLQYGQALAYFEKALSTRLGNTTEVKGDGFTNSMHKSRLKHLKLNNKGTIAIYKKLAAMHIIKKDYAIAKSYYKKALTASRLVFGENDTKTLEVLDLVNQL